MRWRVFAWVSLGVNLALVVALLSFFRGRPPAPDAGLSSPSAGTTLKTNIVVRGRAFSWRDLESADYPTYIANLRDVGCPEQTIRDIIIADVNAIFTIRQATNVVTAEQQWWRSEPDSNVLAAASIAMRALDDERRALLTRLLGPNWESGDLASLPRPSRQGIVLDGPVLGSLPAETRQSLEEVTMRSQDRLQAYLDNQRLAGVAPDPVELAKIRLQTRSELEKLLSPSQLEEFLLRYSQNAIEWRATLGQLKYLDASPEEFRALFRATDTLDEKIELLANATDPNGLSARKALEDQRENAIKLALGAKRYEYYRKLQDPLYRDAVAAAREAGTPDAADTMYRVSLAALDVQDRIRTDVTLTPEQKNVELKRLELEQLQANTLAAGKELPPDPDAPAPPPRKIYTVQQGDNAAVVATIYGVPVSAIQAANPNVDLSRLRPGDTLNIPRNTAPQIPPIQIRQ